MSVDCRVYQSRDDGQHCVVNGIASTDIIKRCGWHKNNTKFESTRNVTARSVFVSAPLYLYISHLENLTNDCLASLLWRILRFVSCESDFLQILCRVYSMCLPLPCFAVTCTTYGVPENMRMTRRRTNEQKKNVANEFVACSNEQVNMGHPKILSLRKSKKDKFTRHFCSPNAKQKNALKKACLTLVNLILQIVFPFFFFFSHIFANAMEILYFYWRYIH